MKHLRVPFAEVYWQQAAVDKQLNLLASHTCPLAKAIQAAYPKYERIRVGLAYVHLTELVEQQPLERRFRLSKTAYLIRQAFDYGKELTDVNLTFPCTFILTEDSEER